MKLLPKCSASWHRNHCACDTLLLKQTFLAAEKLVAVSTLPHLHLQMCLAWVTLFEVEIPTSVWVTDVCKLSHHKKAAKIRDNIRND